ncbi:unnamed protein product [Soboliphyme baturini]|uniref:Peptidase_M13 domain-containing protein n=1 Tax=Soboliphyme baturini TaxID=241478 RepID=A0A183IHI8_9BILA|nr:unnamed protein product [Soboliphyme baturini]
MTTGCIKAAADLLTSLDNSVDPCDDFYEFACGNWVKNHPIPDHLMAISNFDEPATKIDHLLEEPVDPKESKVIAYSKRLYAMCKNESAIFYSWKRVFNETIRRLGGWPLLDLSNDTGLSLGTLYGYAVVNYTQDSLFKLAVGPDEVNSSLYIFQMDQTSLKLIIKELYQLPQYERERRRYLDLMVKSMILLGLDRKVALKEMNEVLRFECQLANITVGDGDLSDDDSQGVKLTLDQLPKSYPNFPWQEFFDVVYPETGGRNRSSIPVYIYVQSYFVRLSELLPQFDVRTVQNYMFWQLFYNSFMQFLPEPFANLKFDFLLAHAPRPRWNTCLRYVDLSLPHATGALYAKRHFDPVAQRHATRMIKVITESFKELLLENDWLSDEARRLAIEKVNAIYLKIGCPSFIFHNDELDQHYHYVEVVNDSFFETKFHLEYVENEISLNKINTFVNKSEWFSGCSVVNAFYSPNTNEIIFPAAILKPVFYSESYPWAMNFGGIGVVIGHEITHGFDDRGRQYDKDGNLREWWDNKTIEQFNQKTKCIERQYSKYRAKQINTTVNGRITKGENIADNGGLKQAFRAYKKWVSMYGYGHSLPGVNFTQDQLFFINYAQVWCGSVNDQELLRRMKTSIHSPGPIRVYGPLSNSADFANSFRCPKGSPMNPDISEKCEVW